MPHVLIINDKPEVIFNHDQFARLLLETLGDDAKDYFLEALNEVREDIDPEEVCDGECEKTYELQEHYERILKDVRDELMSWRIVNLTKEELLQKRFDLCEMIQSEL